MKNIWLDIQLSDYENHMALPYVAQAQYLSEHFSNLLKRFNPRSVAIFGCSGGNGLEHIDNTRVEKVICVDINSDFLKEAAKRFGNKFSDIEFVCANIASMEFHLNNVNLIYAGLVFEYVDPEATIKNASKSLDRNGILAVVLQKPNKNIAEVTPSQYKSLEVLSRIFNFVAPEEFITLCNAEGLALISANETKLDSKKSFTELMFRKL